MNGGVSEGDSVAGVADLVMDAGVGGAVVLRGTEPVGMLDARDVVALVADGRDAEAVTAGDVMDAPATTIDPDSPLREAVSTFASRDLRRLVVTDGDEVVGTISEHDVIAAQATFPDSEAEEAPVAVAGSEAGGDDRFSTQSVCEACGALAGNLTSVNGQLLCADCREM
jgi:signal-transduction protein with cAMP-binding, CBS, and nucleotidyltransferase domain